MAEQTNGLHDALAAAVGPIKEQLALVEREIEELEATLAQKRKDRTAARNVLRVLDPESVPKQSKSKPKLPKLVAAATVDELHEYLRQRDNGEPISAPSLFREQAIGKSRPTLTAALTELAERGLLRLDHVEQPGGEKFYKLVATQP